MNDIIWMFSTPEGIIQTLVVGGIGCILLGTGIYHILRFFKGTIKITLTNTIIYYKDIIEGNVEIKAKLNVAAEKVVVAIVGEEYIRSGKSGRWQEFFRKETLLSAKKKFNQGNSTVFNFKIDGPEKKQKEIINTNNPVINGIFKIASMLGSNKTRWSIQARVYAEGIDLFGTKKIQVYEKNQKGSSTNYMPETFLEK